MTDLTTVDATDRVEPVDSVSTDATASSPTSTSSLRETALTPGVERDTLFMTHPLTKRPVEIRTQAIESAFLDVCEAVTYRQLGLCFSAPFRVGKSTAALMVAANIKQSVDKLAVHLVVAKSHERVTERVFYGDLSESMQLTATGTAEARASRVRKAIQAACQMAHSDQFLLIIDEGQNWDIREWEWLRDTSNDLLNNHKITLTTAVFADPRIAQIRTKFREQRQDLWGRFLMKLKSFSGITSVDDLAHFLSMLDDSSSYEYPAGSGISYTEFYFPAAFAAGWRMNSQADEVWQAFERAAGSVNRKLVNVGMQAVGDTIGDFFTRYSCDDSDAFTAAPWYWDRSIAAANFVDYLV